MTNQLELIKLLQLPLVIGWKVCDGLIQKNEHGAYVCPWDRQRHALPTLPPSDPSCKEKPENPRSFTYQEIQAGLAAALLARVQELESEVLLQKAQIKRLQDNEVKLMDRLKLLEESPRRPFDIDLLDAEELKIFTRLEFHQFHQWLQEIEPILNRITSAESKSAEGYNSHHFLAPFVTVSLCRKQLTLMIREQLLARPGARKFNNANLLGMTMGALAHGLPQQVMAIFYQTHQSVISRW